MDGETPGTRGDQVDRPARHQGPRERAGGQTHRLDEAAAEPEHLGHDDAERGAARDAEDRGLGERVAGQGLEAGPRHRQRATRQQGGEDAR